MRRSPLAAAAAIALTAACGGSPQSALSDTSQTAGAATSSARSAGGRIRGVVKVRGNVPARSEAVAENQAVCGESVPVTRLAVGRDNGVKHAFVYLEDVASPEPAARPRVAVTIEQKGCQYLPHSLVYEPGAGLEIVNSDPILHNVHARAVTGNGLQTVFNIAQPVRGQRTRLDDVIKHAGVVALSCEAGHPWMSAHILVSDHPYVAVTDDNGEFVIEGVPPGNYSLKLWHEGVALKRVITALQQFEYEEPYEKSESVAVTDGGETVINFELALRQP